jgi:hypothetical protein
VFTNVYFKSSSKMAARKARPIALRFRSLAIRLKCAHRCCAWWTSSASIRRCRQIEDRGVSSPAHPCYTKDLNAVQLKVASAAAARSRVREYPKVAADAAKAFFGPARWGSTGELRNRSEPYRQARRSTPASAAQNCVEIV